MEARKKGVWPQWKTFQKVSPKGHLIGLKKNIFNEKKNIMDASQRMRHILYYHYKNLAHVRSHHKQTFNIRRTRNTP